MISVNQWCLLQSNVPCSQSYENSKLHEQITNPYRRSQQQGRENFCKNTFLTSEDETHAWPTELEEMEDFSFLPFFLNRHM